MKKVYLIYEASGSWEDYRQYLIDARFDKDESDHRLNELRSDLDNKIQRLLGLEVHVDNCFLEDSCDECDKFFELQNDMGDMKSYIQREIKVLEKGEVYINV